MTLASADTNRPTAVSSERPAKGTIGKPRPRRAEQKSTVTKPVIAWPSPGTVRVQLPPGGGSAKTSVRAGKTAVTLGPAQGRGAARSTVAARAAEAELRFLDRAAAERAGIDGVLLTLGNATAGTDAAPLTAKVTVDYSAFARAAGGNFGSRLQFVRMPACVLVTPEKPECRVPVPLEGRNDAEARTVTADAVAVPPGAPAGMQSQLGAGTATVLGLTAGSSSLSGDFKASPMGASSSWNTELNTGTFTTAYGMAVPSVPGAFVPKVSLNYSSGTIDGRTTNGNNQASWAGDGFDMSPGFVERSYKPCGDEGVKKDTNEIGDLCWGYDNATISFAGHSGELIPVGTDEWRLKGDDSTKVTRVKDTSRGNGDNDGEYFKAVVSDGTTYWFGYNRLDNWATGKTETKSVFTVPVYGNNAGEPCYNADIKSAWCQQGWRWNLDKAVDTKGNVITYWYGQEGNSYGRYLTAADDTPYVRGGSLDHIEYGLKSADIYSATVKPMARVNFKTAERCLETATLCDPAKIDTNRQYWYDTPWDMNCKAATDCDAGRFSPTFFTRTRLASVTTQTLQTDGTYKDIDSWTLNHRWGTSDTDYQLILSSIDRKGLAGATAIPLPPTVLGYTQKMNRLDKTGDGRAPFVKERLSSITDEAGGQVDVNYSAEACSWSALPTPETNTTRCFPQQYQPSNKTAVTTEWFNKFVVDSVITTDLTGGSPDMVTRYTYLGDAAWAFDDDDGLTKEKLKTWSQWRGYQQTRVQTGGTLGMSTQVDHWFLRGRDGDRSDPTDKTKKRSVSVPDGVGGTITDDQAWAGYEYRTETYDAPGGKILAKTVSTPWKKETAKRVRDWGTTTANITNTETSRSYTSMDDGAGSKWREVRSKNFFDDYGRAERSEDLGDVSVATDDTCTRTTYADNTSAWILTGVVRQETVAANCSAAVDRDTQADGTSAVLSDVRTRYDGQAYGAAPTKGLPTMVSVLKQRTGTKATYLDGATTFDTYGRPLTTTQLASTSVFDPADPAQGTTTPVTTAHPDKRVTTTAYTPATGRPTKSTVTTPPATVGNAATAQTSTTYYDMLRGLPTGEEDANKLRTDVLYDALGRNLKLWKPDRSKLNNQTPNIEYRYNDDAADIRSVQALTLNSDGSQSSSFVLYDGLRRERQSQGPGDNGGKLLTDTFYDARGLVERAHATYYATGAPSGKLFKLEDTTGVETQTTSEYDGLGRPTKVTQLAGNGVGSKVLATTRTIYGGDRVTVIPPKGGTTTTSISDAAGQVTELLQYRSAEPTGPADSTTYAYDPAGHLVKLTDPSNNAWTWTYDQLGREKTATDPDTGTSKKYYNDRGELTSSENGNKKTTAFAYDNLSRQIESRADSATGRLLTSQTWDPLNNKGMVGSSSRYVTVGANTYEYKSTVNVYDALYRPNRTTLTVPSVTGQESLAGTYVTGTSYNLDGTVKSLAYPAVGNLAAEALAFTYDSLRRQVTASSLLSGYLAKQTYSLTGKPLQSTLNAGGKNVWITNEWEWGTQRLTGSRTDLEGGSGAERAADYTYDEAGNVTSLSDLSRYGQDKQCFTYDHLARVTEAFTPTSTPCPALPAASDLGGPAPYWTSWTYNTDGTRKTETEHDPSGNAAADKVRSYSYPVAGSARPHSLSGTSMVTGGTGDPVAESYVYDASGNTTERHLSPEPGTTSDQILDWDAQGKLTKLTDTVKKTADGLTVTTAKTSDYVYAPDGSRLLSHDVDSATPEAESTTLYLGGTELKLTKGETKPRATRYYSLGAAVAVRTDDNKVSFQVTDHHNTGSLDIDASGAVVDQRRMTPFGKQRGAAPADWAGSRGFVGGTMDPTGLTHLGAREYDPSTGRFVSVDPVLASGDIQSLNGYVYSNNNPMTLADPSGLRPDGICGGNSSTCRASDSGNEMSTTYHESWEYKGTGWKWSKYVENKAGTKRWYTYGGVNWGTVVDLTPRKIKWNWNTLAGAVRSVASTADTLRPMPIGPSITQGYDALVNKLGGDTSDPAYEDGEDLADLVGLVFTGVGGAAKGAAKGAKALGKCPNSFVEGTQVLLADGTTKPIEDVRVGDKVVATDPKTGQTRVETVTAEIKGQGLKHLVKVTIDIDGKAGKKTAQVTATDGHPFWVPELGVWARATDLRPGQWLQTSSGTFVQVAAVERWTNPGTSVYNLTVSDLHTYYVLAGTTPILVHNCGEDTVWEPFRKGVDHTDQGPLPAHAGIPAGASLDAGEYHFIVRQDGSLRAMQNESMWDLNPDAGHTSLGDRRGVLMAGTFDVDANGAISRVDNFSGHYRPTGSNPLLSITRRAFQGHGWDFHDGAWDYYAGPPGR
ncbi:polymorphic toxin-type HINT domain-containing protein [Streptomyces sp. NPDC050600]|uniref:polymorphic toxin-type HINT domain-containing protein n=1 Tax=Streptomyces sp. NPDC050600 TaxID=3157213 RepID=UPI003426C594